MLQKLVVDVLGVGGEDGAPADEATDNGERRLQNRQAKGNHRNGHSDNGGRLLRAFQSQSAEHEADEETARISQENRSGIEVVTQETKDRPGQGDGHHRDQVRTIQERDDKGYEGGKQS